MPDATQSAASHRMNGFVVMINRIPFKIEMIFKQNHMGSRKTLRRFFVVVLNTITFTD